MSGFVTKKVNTGNFNTFFCHGGEQNEETIIFLHGSGPGANSESNWSGVLGHFAQNYQVVAPDYYGFGKSDLPQNSDLTFWEWTSKRIEQIIELMDYLNIEKAHLVGNSMGGVVSLHALMEVDNRFEKIILMGSGGGIFSSPTGLSPEIFRMTQFFRNPTEFN